MYLTRHAYRLHNAVLRALNAKGMEAMATTDKREREVPDQSSAERAVGVTAGWAERITFTDEEAGAADNG